MNSTELLILLLRRVAALLLLTQVCGCGGTDSWYRDEGLYNDALNLQAVGLREEEILPGLRYRDAVGLPSAADGRVRLSLEQAVFFSLEHNRSLQVERYFPVIAGSFEQLERGVYDREVFAELAYTDESVDETASDPGGSSSVESRDFELVAGLRQELPTGTRLEASLGYGRRSASEEASQQDVRAGLTLTQSLLRGFGAAVNLVSVYQARLDGRSSMFELRGFVEALISEVEINYWRYVSATQGITIFERSLEVARAQLKDVESRIEVGLIPKNSAFAARAEVARQQQELLEARSRQIEERLRLLRLLNVTEDKHFQLEVEPTSQPDIVAFSPGAVDERLQLALRLRPDLGEARLRMQRQSLEVVRTRNGLLPRLELFIDLGKTGYAASYGDAWSNIDGKNYDFQAGVRFSHYLDNRSARSRDLAARASREQALASIENLENMIQLDVRLALNEIERTRQQIEASRATRRLEEQTLNAEQERFLVGDTTSLLVAQAQRDLLVSQLAQIQSIVDYRIALVKLYLAEGSLLERRGITLGGL
jgi:outer membrane protein